MGEEYWSVAPELWTHFIAFHAIKLNDASVTHYTMTRRLANDGSMHIVDRFSHQQISGFVASGPLAACINLPV